MSLCDSAAIEQPIILYCQNFLIFVFNPQLTLVFQVSHFLPTPGVTVHQSGLSVETGRVAVLGLTQMEPITT